jgi:hypothetical protein
MMAMMIRYRTALKEHAIFKSDDDLTDAIQKNGIIQ